MKRTLLLFILAFPFLIYGQSPSKLIAKGEYDKAIETCVDKLKDGKGKKDDLYAELKYAYETASQNDVETITSLKSSGQPHVWLEVYMSYLNLQNRYTLVSSISDMLENDRVSLQLYDYSTDLEVSRQNAAAYLYAHSISLLKTGAKADAGKAYEELLLISKMYDNYKDVELQMRRALGGSTNLARLEVNNLTGASLSPDIIADIEDLGLTFREKQYLDYIVKAKPGQQFSIILAIDISSVNVTPGTVSEKEYTSSHKNPESFSSAYENPSKFEEDKKHQDFNKCKVTEIYQIKTAVIKGKIKYVDESSKAVLYMIPVTVRSVFENRTATASGDLYACPPEIMDILDKPKLKFPKNGEMITMAIEKLKVLVKSTIWHESFITD